MILDFSQNNIKAIFEVDENGIVTLNELCVPSYKSELAKNKKYCHIVDIHISGENADDHHGSKHTGASSNATLRYKSHTCEQNEKGTLVKFLLADSKMEATVHYQFYDGISAIRSWTSVKNISTEPLGIEYISSFAYTGLENSSPLVYMPHNTWCREVNWKKCTLSQLGLDRTNPFSIKKIGASNTGSWSSKEYLPMGAISDTENTLLWQIENNGSWQWEISDVSDMLYLKLSGPNETENGWYKCLAPNEEFVSVKASIAISNSFDSALCELTKYRRAIIKNNKENATLPVIFNDYMNCLWGDPTEEKLIPIIERAASLGAEYFCVDAGWYADGYWWDSVGEWLPCDWRFPNGIKSIFDRIREKGMIPGIWLEIEVMGIVCPILDKFDDSCFFMRHGKRVIDHGRYQLDFRSPKVREHASAVIDRVVNEYGVGYIKMDYNIEAGVGTETDADSFGDGLLKHNRAYLAWLDEIMQKYPSLIIECCSSGGMRMDYAMLERAHLQSVSDQESYKNTALVSSNMATAILPEQGAIWSYPLASGDENEASFNMIGTMLQRMHLSGEVARLSQKQLDEIAEGVALYKSYRHKIPALLPFYPLGLNSYTDGWACAGYRTDDEKYIALWRLNGENDEIFVPLDTAERAQLLYPSSSKCKITKKQDGVLVSLPDCYSAILLKA